MKTRGEVIVSLLIAGLAIGLFRATLPKPQTGGGDVCPCGTAWIVTATFQMVVSPTPSHTPTPTPIDGSATPIPTITPFIRSTPTRLPTPAVTVTPRLTCRIPGAAEYEKLFVYVFTDKQQRGLDYQNVRFGPGTQYAIVGSLLVTEQKRSPVYWRYNGWSGINETCTRWVLNLMGEEYPAGTD